MKRKYLLLIFSVVVHLSVTRAVAQTDKPQVIPPSPRSAEYAKYITYNVSLYNGLPEISIPLYEIKLKDLTIPVVLNYHASGIKYDQDNGEVGVGWSLSTGYRVSRTMYGWADDKWNFLPHVEDSMHYHDIRGFADRAKFLARFMELESGTVSRPNTEPGMELDGEYDQFNFNLPSESGSFIITDRVNRTVSTLEVSNTRISYNTGNSGNGWAEGFLGFNMVDETGIKYYFGEALPLNGNSVFEHSFSYYDGHLNTAWALTDIKTPLGEAVHFDYSPRVVTGWKQYQQTFTVREAVQSSSAPPFFYDLNDDDVPASSYNTFELDDITTAHEKVTFERIADGTIKNIYIHALEGNQLLKRIEFVYSGNIHHTFLDTVKIYDKTTPGRVVETYKFDYYKKDVSSWPTFIPDQWGYYMPAVLPTNLFHAQMANDMIFASVAPFERNPLSQYLSAFSPRDHISFAPDFFSLRQIVYPTGGSTEYEYESNRYKDERYDFGAIKDGGGIRIKRIKSHDQLNGETLIRDFVYGDGENGYGYTPFSLNYRDFVKENIFFATYNGTDLTTMPQRVISYSTTLQGDVDLGAGLSSYVAYPAVTEYLTKPGWNAGTSGKIIHKFDLGHRISTSAYAALFDDSWVPADGLQYHGSSPQYVSRYRYWDKPKLSTRESYAYKNDGYQIVKYENFYYDSLGVNVYTGLKVKPFATAQSYSPTNMIFYVHTNSFFDFGTYTVETGKNVLSKKLEWMVTETGNFETLTTYHYNSRGQISKEDVIESSGSKLVTYYRYPHEVAASPSTNAQTNPIGFLVGNNMIAQPVETVQTREAGGTEKVLSAQATTYKGVQLSRNGNSFYTVLPDKLYKLEVTGTLDKDDYSFFSTPAGESGETNNLDTRLKPRLAYNLYDTYGNLCQFTPVNGMPQSYLWGYDGRYPVAEIKNASSNEFYFEDFEDNGTTTQAHTGNKGFSSSFTPTFTPPNSRSYVVGWWTLTNGEWVYDERPYTGQTLSGIIDDVRIFPKDAQLGTYTFTPFIGMTSSSTPSGLPTYFEYDDFNRLTSVRDHNRDILKTYQYKYVDDVVIYYNTVYTRTVQKSGCASGYAGSQVTYQVPAGTYYSRISEADANTQASQDADANAQNYANTYGQCLVLYYNVEKQGTFTRNNCLPGMEGETLTYTVQAGKYSSTTSQAFVDAQAQADVDANGQTYVNTEGKCDGAYYSIQKSGYFSKNDCGPSQVPGPAVEYVVEAGKYTSTISQADADSKAQQDLDTNGQDFANNEGSCIPIVEVTLIEPMAGATVQFIQFYKGSELYATFNPVNNGGNETFNIPVGDYKVVFELAGSVSVPVILSFNNGAPEPLCVEFSGTSAVLQNITIAEQSNYFRVQDVCQN